VLPFAFFFTEAEGFGGRRRFLSRVVETAATVALVLLLLYLLLVLIGQYKPDADPAPAQYKPDAGPAPAQYKPDADQLPPVLPAS